MSNTPNTPGEGNSGQETAKAGSAALAVKLPPNWKLWAETRRLVADEKLRLGLLIEVVCKDPVLVIEILKTANALYMSSGSPITSIKTAVTRLGSDTLLEALDKMKEERKPIEDAEVLAHLERHRQRALRMAFVAKTLADTLAKNLVEDCQACGLLMTTGEILAVAHITETYCKLAKDLPRSNVNYKLAQEHKFDVDKMCLAYLRKTNIPELLLFALDRDSRPPSPARAIMKPICFGAAELVDAFEASRWDKYAPGKSIPPKSSLRLLQISEAQYGRIYEASAEFLGASASKEKAGAAAPAP